MIYFPEVLGFTLATMGVVIAILGHHVGLGIFVWRNPKETFSSRWPNKGFWYVLGARIGGLVLVAIGVYLYKIMNGY